MNPGDDVQSASPPDAGIVQRTGRMTVKAAIELGGDADRVINHCISSPGLQETYDTALVGRIAEFSFNGSAAVRGLGEPLVRVREFESSPGLWVFDDASSGVVFLIWSDGYKTKPWKGTSYEVVASPAKLPLLAPAFQRLLDFVEAAALRAEPKKSARSARP